MTWTITARGSDVQGTSSADLTSDTFTPAAECLLVACLFQNEGVAAVNSISGHGTWSRIFQSALLDIGYLELWACLTGASPSSAQIAIDIDYINRTIVQFVEIDETNGFDATLANNFGTQDTDTVNNGSSPTLTATVASFGQSTNMAFGFCGNDASTASNITQGSGFTELNEINDGSIGRSFATFYRTSEDTTIDASSNQSSLDMSLAGIEIKHQAGSPITIAVPVGPWR